MAEADELKLATQGRPLRFWERPVTVGFLIGALVVMWAVLGILAWIF